MAREGLEVADVFRRFGPAFREQHGASLSPAQRHAMTAIESCRTAALGGHVEQCGDCGHQRVSYNSCRDRNCPKCQGLARAQWLEDRQAELLDDARSGAARLGDDAEQPRQRAPDAGRARERNGGSGGSAGSL